MAAGRASSPSSLFRVRARARVRVRVRVRAAPSSLFSISEGISISPPCSLE